MAGESNLPVSARLDRAALERVLARAAELQASDGEPGEPGEELSEQQILDLGKEVGLSSQHLRQALAEERTRIALPAPERGVVASLFGTARASATRTVPGAPRDVIAATDAWMQREECLIVKRQFPDRIVWEPRRDIGTAIRRGLRVGGRSYALTYTEEVAVTAVAVDEGRTLVRLDADLAAHRTSLVRQSAGATTLGIAGSATMVALGFALPLAILPAAAIAVGTLYGAREMNLRRADAAQLALEQLLDRLERGEIQKPAPTLLNMLAAAAATLPRRY